MFAQGRIRHNLSDALAGHWPVVPDTVCRIWLLSCGVSLLFVFPVWKFELCLPKAASDITCRMRWPATGPSLPTRFVGYGCCRVAHPCCLSFLFGNLNYVCPRPHPT